MIIENEQAEIESIQRMVEAKEELAFQRGQQSEKRAAYSRGFIDGLEAAANTVEHWVKSPLKEWSWIAGTLRDQAAKLRQEAK